MAEPLTDEIERLIKAMLSREVVTHLIKATNELTQAMEAAARNLPMSEDTRRVIRTFKEEFDRAYNDDPKPEREEPTLEKIEFD